MMAGMGFYGLVGAGIGAMRTGWTSVHDAKAVPTSTKRRHVWFQPSASGMRVGYTRRFEGG